MRMQKINSEIIRSVSTRLSLAFCLRFFFQFAINYIFTFDWALLFVHLSSSFCVVCAFAVEIFIYDLILMIYEAFDDKYRYQLINIRRGGGEGIKLINGIMASRDSNVQINFALIFDQARFQPKACRSKSFHGLLAGRMNCLAPTPPDVMFTIMSYAIYARSTESLRSFLPFFIPPQSRGNLFKFIQLHF